MPNIEKSGCHGCRYGDWDADGCTCKLDGLLVPDPRIGCKYRKADEDKPMTNGDKIRAMTDEELAALIANENDFCSLCAYKSDDPICCKPLTECTHGFYEWLKQEVSEDAFS